MKEVFKKHLLPCLSLLIACAIPCQAEKVIIMGSDTLGSKLAVQLAEAFKAKMEQRNTPVAFEITSEGTTTALASVIDGHAAIGMASRAPRTTELTKAQAKGVQLRSISVAHDAIAIIVNEANPLESLSLEELEAIYSGDAQDWSAISTEVTGPISAYTRNSASGTYSILQDKVLASRNYGENTLQLAGNEQIAAEVASNPDAIGYVGLAYTRTPGLKVLAISDTKPADKDYPLGRELRYLVDGNKPLNAMTNDFIGFTLSPEGQQIVQQVHFLPIY